MDLDKIKQQIEDHLALVFDRERDKHASNPIMLQNIEDFIRLTGGGKRIRGIMVALGASLNAPLHPSYIEIASAIEIMQTAILIHDDIIDKAKTRRGQITIHAKYHKLGLEKAICMADYGFFLAYQIICECKISDDVKNEVLRILSDTMYNTVVGEIMDVELPHQDNPTEQDLAKIYINKTAWYTIIGPMLMGAALNQESDLIKSQIENFGLNLGIAYQIKDDIISIMAEDTNKSLDSDIKEGKITKMYLYTKARLNSKTRQIMYHYGKEDATKNAIKKIKALFKSNDAIKVATEEAEQYTDKALQELEKMKINDSTKKTLRTLTNKLLSRKY